jgi:high-affinity Fe2+/Pb2+ permease
MSMTYRDPVKRFLPSIVLNAGVPFVAYLLLRPVVSDIAALAVACAIPVLYTIGTFAIRRRFDPIGVVAVAGFAVALGLALVSGGNQLVLKLQDALLTGPIGLVCLISVVVGRPLHAVLLALAARRNPRLALTFHRRASMIITAVLGATLVVHALVLLALALTLPTSTYLALARPVGLTVVAAGLGGMFWYRRRLRQPSRPPSENG